MSPPERTAAAPPARRPGLLAGSAICALLIAAPALAGPELAFTQTNAGGMDPVVTMGTARTDVQLNAPRTVISWTTFNVTPDETVSYSFGARNWIVLNKIVGLAPSKIEGIIEGKVGDTVGGNIWFISQNSIIIGKGARIDAGGILLGIGSADTQSFLDPANTLFSVTGGDSLPGAKIQVLANAALTANGGMIALVGPSIVTRANATVTASDSSVLYGSAKTFQIRMAPGTGGDFDLVDFLVPDASAGGDSAVALDLAGVTKANAVFVAAVSKTALGSAVINLEGMVTAQAAKADGGDIVLSGGGSIVNRGIGPTIKGASGGDIFLNRASASRDLKIKNTGRVFPRPWVRPLEDSQDPPTLYDDANQPVCDPFATFNSCGIGVEVLENLDLLKDLFDPTAISVINAGRDASILATASIDLGRIVAGGNVTVEGLDVRANSLVASGNLNVNATAGAIDLAGIGVSHTGSITGAGDITIGAISAPQKLTVTAGGGISVGEGVSTVDGVITLTAAQSVSLNLASAKIDTISAGTIASLKGGSLDIGTVTAPKFFAQAASVKIGTANSSGDIYAIATSGDASVGTANAGDDVYVIATHGTASLGSATVGGVGFDSVSLDFVGNPDVAGNGRVVRVESTDMDAKLGLGTGSVTGATSVQVSAGQDAAVDVLKDIPGIFTVSAARDATLKGPGVKLDSVAAGRDLVLGSSAGDFTVTQSLSATRNITVSAAGALKVADVRADNGSVSLIGASVTAGNVSASDDLLLKAISGAVTTASYKVGRDLTIQGSSISLGSAIAPVARDLSITSLGNFTATSPLAAGRNLTLDVGGKAVLGAASATQTVRILAGDLDLTGQVSGATVQIESRNGALRVGGGGGDTAGSMTLDNTDFGQLRATGQVRIYAGSTTGAARGDLTVQNLTVNPGATPNVALIVSSGNSAQVPGVVAPTANGGIFRIGDAADLTWRPSSIFITGSIGAASFNGSTYSDIRAFDEVRLAARQDILMGSPRFISLIQDTAITDIDVAAGKPTGVAPTASEQFKVFISTGKLEVSANNKVVQQNTGAGAGFQAVGTFLTGKFNPALVIDPPQVVELYGAFSGIDGKVVSGTAAGSAVTFTVVDTNGAPITRPNGAAYRFNSCDVGTSNCGFSASSSIDTMMSQTNSGLLTARDGLSDGSLGLETSDEAAAAAVSSEALTNPPVLLGVAPVDSDAIILDPVVTGTGSEEIWRQRRQKK